MEQKRILLPLAGKIQHGKQEQSQKGRKIIELGYFIAKAENETLTFLENRFNEKYPQKQLIHIRFFDENPYTVRRIRYNQSGAVCYCPYEETQGKQKVSGVWKTINCTEDCKYRITEEGKNKPACLFEGNLRFLLPEISQDRIWRMQIKGYQSIFALYEYLSFQKYLGKSLIGDYYLFLKKKKQTSKDGKSYENYILDIIRKEDFISNNDSLNNTEQSTIQAQNVDNSIEIPSKIESKNDSNSKDPITEVKNKEQTKVKATKTKKTENKTTSKKENEAPVVESNVTNLENNENSNPDDKFKNYYLLLDMQSKTLMNAGKLTDYLVANFVDQYDNIKEVIIAPQFIDEISNCGTGTNVILDLAIAGDKTFTKDIKFVKKMPKDVAA